LKSSPAACAGRRERLCSPLTCSTGKRWQTAYQGERQIEYNTIVNKQQVLMIKIRSYENMMKLANKARRRCQSLPRQVPEPGTGCVTKAVIK
jgi:hypothetical protein